MSKDDWLKWYEARTGCKDLELSEGEQIFFHPKHGFIAYYMHDDVLELHHLCGDGKSWQKVLVKIMEEFGLKKLRAYTRRNPEAWKRKYGGHIRGWYMEASLDELRDERRANKEETE